MPRFTNNKLRLDWSILYLIILYKNLKSRVDWSASVINFGWIGAFYIRYKNLKSRVDWSASALLCCVNEL
jgi:hypothetical protein